MLSGSLTMRKIHYPLLVAALLACGQGAVAQTVDPLWDGPQRLSTSDGSVLDRSIAVDSRGRAHAFWVEDRLFEGAHRLQYSRFGGKTWTTPAVRVSERTESFAGAMSDVEAVIDSSDVIHVIWHGRGGPIQHSSVSVDRALSPSAWSEPASVSVPVLRSKLLLDSQGALTIVYSPVAGVQPAGLASIRSTDGGNTWSEPVQIDPQIPNGYRVQDFDADEDGVGGIHVVWTYVSDAGYEVLSVQYARSMSSGISWSAPSAVESATEEDRYAIRLANPEVRVSGASVHIVYAGGGADDIGRRHVHSSDSGATWSEPQTILAGLEGAAGADSSYFDSAGRFHLFAQLQSPVGVYHATFANGEWSEAQRIYLIADDPQSAIGNRIAARWFEATALPDDRAIVLMESCGAACQDSSTLPGNPILFALNSILPPGAAPLFTSVSSATYKLGQPLAPAAIAAGFGEALNGRIMLASETPLPTTLDGVEIEVRDAREQSLQAGIQFVSPQQLNYVVPEGCAPGLARVRVRRGGELIAAGTLAIGAVSPAIYTVNGQGTGVAAASWLFVANDGSRTSGLVFDPTTGGPLPIAFNPGQGDLYLSIYGTGLRGFQRYARAEVGGRMTAILSVGPQGQFEGLDQVNVGPLPFELAAGGDLEIVITVDDVESNRASIEIE